MKIFLEFKSVFEKRSLYINQNTKRLSNTACAMTPVSMAPRVSPSWGVSEQWAAGGHTVGSVAMVAKVRCNTSYCQHQQHPHTSTSAVYTYQRCTHL